MARAASPLRAAVERLWPEYLDLLRLLVRQPTVLGQEHAARDAGPPLRGTVLFESVIEEECDGNGTLAARLRSGPVDGAVIAEPTDLTTWIATPGVLWFEVTVTGRPAYVGFGSQTVNAI